MTQINAAQLTSVIRYHLGELGARNGHHEFEHLSRHLARARVYSNILPATGPVSAGGDGGRDFETFRTSVSFPLTAGSTFAQTTSRGRDAAFACTLETRIIPKIKRDIDKILAAGPVDEIVYFCEADIPVAKRHKLEGEARRKNVTLQVFDGQAISEMLTDRDTFWIAQEYLKIPADYMPRSADDSDWYGALVARWANRQPIALSRADFMEIKAGLRHSTFHVETRQDLLAWLGRMEAFLATDVPRSLQRNAEYEVIIATYRGTGDFHRRISLVDSYFSDFEDYLGLADLQDAATLLVYGWGACLAQHYGGDPEQLFDWRRALITLLEGEVINAPGPGRRSGLLQIRGYLETMSAEVGGSPDLKSVARHWSQMLGEVERAPLFPIAAFADNLSKFLALLGPHPDLIDLASRVDDLVANRAGAAEAGQNAFGRALAFLEHDHKLAAIRELHRARQRWFSGDRVEEALDVMIRLSDCYRQLGLAYAAKYYALSVAYFAANEQRHEVARLLPRALFSAVDAEDAAGNGVGLASLILSTLGAHAVYDRDPFDTSKHPRIQENLGQMQALLGLLNRGDVSIYQNVRQVFASWPAVVADPLLEGCTDPKAFWNAGSWGDTWQSLDESLLDRPWGDVGAVRVVRWDALGISWSCQFDNTLEVTPAAEQIIAQLQLIQATVAVTEADLALVPVNAILSISVAKKARKIKLSEPRYDGEALSLQLTVPASHAVAASLRDTIVSLFQTLACCSVFRLDQFFSASRELVAPACEQAFNIRPYHEAYSHFVSAANFFDFARTSTDGFRSDMPFPRKDIGEMGGNRGLGPTYGSKDAPTEIASRYATWIPYVRFTVRNLMADPQSRAMLQQLHDEGMKDWQILTLIGNLVFNARGAIDPEGDMTESKLVALKETIGVPETEVTALGPAIMAPDMIRLQRHVFVSLMLNHWDLDGSSGLVESRAAEGFLIERYRIYEDDADHEDLFAWNGRP